MSLRGQIHVRWDGSIAGLIGCAVHRTPRLDGGPVCREPDPLTFANSQRSPNSLCRSCGTDLSLGTHDSTTVPGESDIHAGEDAYRAALSGVAPGLLGKATDRAFRQFVEDMLQVLTHCLNFHSAGPPPGAMPFSRQDIQQIVAALILNAVPSPDQSKRNKRYARGLHLWATLLKVIPPTPRTRYPTIEPALADSTPPPLCLGSASPHPKTLALHPLPSSEGS